MRLPGKEGDPKVRCLLERNPEEPILAGFLDKESGFGVALFLFEGNLSVQVYDIQEVADVVD